MELVPYDPQAPATVPQHGMVQAGQKKLGDGMSGESVNKITLKPDRTFTISLKGQDVQSLPSPIQVVIQSFNSNISRNFYQKAYDPKAKPTAPDCYSDDGVEPALNAKARQHTACDLCPQNIKGERGKPCRQFKRIAVTLVGDSVPGRVFQIDCSATSVFGNEFPQTNQYNLKGLAAQLDGRNVNANAMVVRLHADLNEEYAKILFEPSAYIGEADYNSMLAAIDQAELAKYVQVDFGGAVRPATPESTASAAAQSPAPPVETAAPVQQQPAVPPVQQPAVPPVQQPAVPPVQQPAVPPVQQPAVPPVQQVTPVQQVPADQQVIDVPLQQTPVQQPAPVQEAPLQPQSVAQVQQAPVQQAAPVQQPVAQAQAAPVAAAAAAEAPAVVAASALVQNLT